MKKLLVALTFNLVLISSKLVAQTWVTIPDANFVTYLQSIIPGAMSGNQMNTSSTLVTTTTHSIICGSMSIANLSGVQYFTSLSYLDCHNNLLTTLPMLPNSLTYLNCSFQNNGVMPYLLSSLPALPTSLTYLNCRYNVLTSLPSLPASLNYLDCGWNNLTSIPSLPNSIQTVFTGTNNIACFPTFPNSIDTLAIDPNPYNCLLNHIAAMDSADLATPLCAAGNTHGCPVAVAGIEQVIGINSNISVYPNPAKDVLYVKGLAINDITHIQLMDMFGNFVAEYFTSDKATDIDVSVLSEGVYNLSITTKEGVINKRVVIEK